jgi:hypothetical protein
MRTEHRRVKRRLRGGLLVFGVIGSLSISAIAAEPKTTIDKADGASSADNTRARELFRLGTNAYKAGRIEEADQFLEEAWLLHRSYDIAASLGQVEFELERFLRALELLDYCLQNFPPIESDERLKKIRFARQQARSRVAEIELSYDSNYNTSGAELVVDDVVVGTLPLTKPLYVAPGLHQFFLRQAGGTLNKGTQVEASAGGLHRIELVGETARQSEPTRAKHSKPASVVMEDGRSKWPISVGGGLVAVNVVAAIAFKMVSHDASERASSLRSKLSESGLNCSYGSAPSGRLSCGQLSDAVSDEDRYSRLSMYATGAAATFTVVTAGYWVWSSTGGRGVQRTGMTTKPSSFNWALFGGRTSASLIATGSF